MRFYDARHWTYSNLLFTFTGSSEATRLSELPNVCMFSFLPVALSADVLAAAVQLAFSSACTLARLLCPSRVLLVILFMYDLPAETAPAVPTNVPHAMR